MVGKAPGRYNLMLGGNHLGTRLNQIYRENLAEPEILSALEPLLISYAKDQGEFERFGDFCVRTGIVAPIKTREISARVLS